MFFIPRVVKVSMYYDSNGNRVDFKKPDQESETVQSAPEQVQSAPEQVQSVTISAQSVTTPVKLLNSINKQPDNSNTQLINTNQPESTIKESNSNIYQQIGKNHKQNSISSSQPIGKNQYSVGIIDNSVGKMTKTITTINQQHNQDINCSWDCGRIARINCNICGDFCVTCDTEAHSKGKAREHSRSTLI
jgi:hypothetical protein